MIRADEAVSPPSGFGSADQFPEAVQAELEPMAALYDEYFERVYRFLYSRVGSKADAEDLTAATFLAAVEAFPRYRQQGKFAAWLFTIARRKAADHFRRPGSVPLDEAEEPAAGQDVLSQVVESDRLRRLRERVRRLPAAEREWLDLHYAAGLTFAEMAEVLGKSESAVKKAVQRLCARLNKDLE